MRSETAETGRGTTTATLTRRGLPALADLASFLRDRLGFLERCARDADAVLVQVGPRRALILSHPELVREVFVHEATHFGRGVSGAIMRPVVGEGLLLAEGAVWRRQRREVQPLFSPEQAAHWMPAIGSATLARLSRWRDGDCVDVHAQMQRLTLDIAARLLLDVEADDQGRLHPALAAMLERDLFRAPVPIGPLGRFIRPDRQRAELDRLVYARIASARGAGRPGVITTLAARGASEREIRDQLVTLLVSAFDTTATALTWMWFLLAQDEAVEETLRLEMAQDPAPSGARPRLDAVFSETLRLFPPVIGQAREVLAACQIGTTRLRPGDLVLFSQWVIHRDPRWFERPEEFLPDRWIDGLEDRLHPCAYFPFGGGRRNCVGRALARAIVMQVVPGVLSRYHLERLGPLPEVDAIVTPRPRGGLPMRVVAA